GIVPLIRLFLLPAGSSTRDAAPAQIYPLPLHDAFRSLEMLGLPFRVVAPGVDETRESSELPEGYVVRLAREKARVVAGREPGERSEEHTSELQSRVEVV